VFLGLRHLPYTEKKNHGTWQSIKAIKDSEIRVVYEIEHYPVSGLVDLNCTPFEYTFEYLGQTMPMLVPIARNASQFNLPNK